MEHLDLLWVEKYRPKTVRDCILPDNLEKTFQQIVDSKTVPNMMLTGTAGTGKTTVARAICEELGLDYIVINSSEEGNIDTLRGKIRQFASSISLTGGHKVVILDEADYLNPQSTQPALRGFIEQFSDNCRFILTCNFKNRIIEPLHSRCGVYEFNTSKKDMVSLCEQFMVRVCDIISKEGHVVETSQRENIAKLIMRYAPDWRRIINELQRSVSSGLDQSTLSSDNYDVLFKSLKNKDFNKMRKWVSENVDLDTTVVFRKIYDNMNENIETKSIPQTVVILAEYQYKNAFVADHELNIVACMTELMSGVEFK